MSKKLVDEKQYECLRGHLEKANEVFKSLGLDLGFDRNVLKPNPKLKETKLEKINRYKLMITQRKIKIT